MNRAFFILITLLTMSFFIGGCRNSGRIGQSVERLIGSEVNTDLEIDTTHGHYTVLRYVKPLSCTSCQLKMDIWKRYRDRITDKFGDKVNIMFIVEAASPSEVKTLMRVHGFEAQTHVDTAGVFIRDNEDVEPLGRDVVMLLDSDKTIRFIGDPSKSYKADSVYNGIISGRL